MLFECLKKYSAMAAFLVKLVLCAILNLPQMVFAGLILCTEEVLVTQLCKKQDNYDPSMPSKPHPANVTAVLDLKSVLDVDADKKTITVYVYLILVWTNFELDVKYPPGKE